MFSPILSPIPIPLASVTMPPFVAALGTATKALPPVGRRVMDHRVRHVAVWRL